MFNVSALKVRAHIPEIVANSYRESYFGDFAYIKRAGYVRFFPCVAGLVHLAPPIPYIVFLRTFLCSVLCYATTTLPFQFVRPVVLANRCYKNPCHQPCLENTSPSRSIFTKIHAIENLRKDPLYNQGVRYYEE